MTEGSMASDWYYSKRGDPARQQIGPLTWEQFYALAQAGTLTPDDLVWNPQFADWVPAAQVLGLFPAAATPAVQAPYPEPVQPAVAYRQATQPAAARSAGRSRSWLYWVVPLVVLVVVGAGLGAYFGFLRDGGGDGSTVSSDATTVTSATAATTSEPATTTTTAAPTLATGLELSNSPVVGDGEVLFEAGSTSETLKVTINGTVPVTDQSAIAWFSMATIRIAPGLTVPLDLLGAFELASFELGGGSFVRNFEIVDHQPTGDTESIGWEACVFEYPIAATSTGAIVAGADGATLKKEGTMLMLMEGDADLLK